MNWRVKPVEACIEGAERKGLERSLFGAIVYFVYGHRRSPLRS